VPVPRARPGPRAGPRAAPNEDGRVTRALDVGKVVTGYPRCFLPLAPTRAAPSPWLPRGCRRPAGGHGLREALLGLAEGVQERVERLLPGHAQAACSEAQAGRADGE